MAQGLAGLSQMALWGGRGPSLRSLPRPPVPGQPRFVFGTLVGSPADLCRPLSTFVDPCRPWATLVSPSLTPSTRFADPSSRPVPTLFDLCRPLLPTFVDPSRPLSHFVDPCRQLFCRSLSTLVTVVAPCRPLLSTFCDPCRHILVDPCRRPL